MMVKDPSGRGRSHRAILLGGCVGEKSGATGYRLRGKVPDEVVPGVIEPLTSFFRDDRVLGESFRDFIDRLGVAEMQRLAEAAAGVVC